MKLDTLLKKALFLEYLTIGWNVFEGISCVAVGFITGSISLTAYGLESSIEVFASSVVVWELRSPKRSKKREERAVKLIGIAYLIVSTYIFIDGSESLIAGHHPQRSFIGIILLTVTLFMMLGLGFFKRFVGKKMKSVTVLADAKFTLIDAALSSTVLVGLIFNTFFGWWWMDQAMALFLSGVAFREGLREVL